LRAEEKQVETAMNVFPNPTDGRITVQFNSASADKYRVTVFSMTGSVVMNSVIDATEGMNSQELDLTNVSKGMYILILEGNNIKEQKRITVQ